MTTPSEDILQVLKSGPKTRAELTAAGTAVASATQSALRRLHKRSSIVRTKPGRFYVYQLPSTPTPTRHGRSPREALKAAIAEHPELAAAIFDAVSPPAPKDPRTQRVRRTPTAAKYRGQS